MKIKKHISLLLITAFLLAVLCPTVMAEEQKQAASINGALQVQAKSAVLIEPFTGKVLFEQNPHEKLPPASVTKVMTLLLIYEALAQKKIAWEDIVTVSDHAASMGGSQVYLEPNEQQTVKTMVKCIAVASANDAAVAMAEHIAGSEPGFVDLMNKKAQTLGMKNTHFENACGLDADGHVTSAYDIALMSRELIIKYPEVHEFTKVWQDTIVHKTKRGEEQFGLTNTNKLLKWYAGATGLKTGSTGKALYCLSGTAEKNGLQLISVVMAAPDYKTRFHEVMKMFDYGFANYAVMQGEVEGKVISTVQVYKGQKEEVSVVVKSSVNLLVKKGTKDTLESKTEIVPFVKAPFEKGVKVGQIIYMMQDKEVGRSDLVVAEAVQKATLGHMVNRLMHRWFQ